MQAAEHRFHTDERNRRQSMSGRRFRNLHTSFRRIRHARTQRAVRTSLIVMSRPLAQNRTQMCFRYRNHPIEALAPYRSNHALDDRVRFRTRYGDRNTSTPRAPIESSRRLAKIRSRSWISSDALLHSPTAVASSPRSGAPSRSHAPVACPMLDDNKHVQHPKRCRDRDKKSHARDRMRMVLQEEWTSADHHAAGPAAASGCTCRPFAARPESRLTQLIGDPLLAPQRVLCRDPANQVTQFCWNRRSARPALPAPDDPPAQSMPANDGRRSNVDHRRAPIEHSREQCEADASGVIQAPRSDATLDITRQLLTKNQVLSADRAGRAQERDDHPQDVRGYSDHRSRQLQHPLIMRESARVCRSWTLKRANYCGAQACKTALAHFWTHLTSHFWTASIASF